MGVLGDHLMKAISDVCVYVCERGEGVDGAFVGNGCPLAVNTGIVIYEICSEMIVYVIS